MPIVQYFITTWVIIVFAEQFGNFLYIDGVIEGGGISLFSFVWAQFALKYISEFKKNKKIKRIEISLGTSFTLEAFD